VPILSIESDYLKSIIHLSSQTSTRFRILRCVRFIVLAMLLFAASCATQKGPKTTDSVAVVPSQIAKGYPDSKEIEKRIRDEYLRWQGTRHRLGGTSPGGIDCSGFVKEVYQNIFNIELPRTTKEQVTKGTPVKKNQLQAGDLVFFNPPTYPRHVGIFLSENEFVHASKREGVIISQIDKYYWGKYYWTARRILRQ
jgi:cell wall-associated NlpC family hydrolase